MSAAFALGKFPAIRIDLEDPVSHLLREHLGTTMPEVLARWLTGPGCLLWSCRPSHFDEMPKDTKKELEPARCRRRGIAVVALTVFCLVVADVLRVNGPPVGVGL